MGGCTYIALLPSAAGVALFLGPCGSIRRGGYNISCMKRFLFLHICACFITICVRQQFIQPSSGLCPGKIPTATTGDPPTLQERSSLAQLREANASSPPLRAAATHRSSKTVPLQCGQIGVGMGGGPEGKEGEEGNRTAPKALSRTLITSLPTKHVCSAINPASVSGG